MAGSIQPATNRRIQASKSGEKQRNLRQSWAVEIGLKNREIPAQESSVVGMHMVRNGESEKSRLARTWNPTLEKKKSGVWNPDRRTRMAPWWEILKIWAWREPWYTTSSPQQHMHNPLQICKSWVLKINKLLYNYCFAFMNGPPTYHWLGIKAKRHLTTSVQLFCSFGIELLLQRSEWWLLKWRWCWRRAVCMHYQPSRVIPRLMDHCHPLLPLSCTPPGHKD